VALVQFGKNCKGNFDGYRIVALDHQRNLLKKYSFLWIFYYYYYYYHRRVCPRLFNYLCHL